MTMSSNKNSISFFWNHLKKWFDYNKRNYPWRSTNDPYHILIAEFLLQQTHVRKVEEVYCLLLRTFPTVEQLSIASESHLIQLIIPIGLTYRALRLKASAQIIQNNYIGKIPDNYNELINLPGVGDYIANAVLCYGYHQYTIPIDTNVIRLFCRYFGLISDKTRSRTDKLLASNIRELYLFDFEFKTANLAVLDFAGLICTAKKPKCMECPLNNLCQFHNKRA